MRNEKRSHFSAAFFFLNSTIESYNFVFFSSFQFSPSIFTMFFSRIVAVHNMVYIKCSPPHMEGNPLQINYILLKVGSLPYKSGEHCYGYFDVRVASSPLDYCTRLIQDSICSISSLSILPIEIKLILVLTLSCKLSYWYGVPTPSLVVCCVSHVLYSLCLSVTSIKMKFIK